MGNRIILVPGLAGLSHVAPAFEQFKPPMSPVELTPRSPYVMARAALVFGSPHTLSPADISQSSGDPLTAKRIRIRDPACGFGSSLRAKIRSTTSFSHATLARRATHTRWNRAIESGFQKVHLHNRAIPSSPLPF